MSFCLSSFLNELQGDQEELKNSPPLEPVVDIQEKDIEDGVSASSAEERDCESLEEGSPITEAYTGMCSCKCYFECVIDVHNNLDKWL